MTITSSSHNFSTLVVFQFVISPSNSLFSHSAFAPTESRICSPSASALAASLPHTNGLCLCPTLSESYPTPKSRIYRLLLPSAKTSEWAEVEVRKSSSATSASTRQSPASPLLDRSDVRSTPATLWRQDDRQGRSFAPCSSGQLCVRHDWRAWQRQTCVTDGLFVKRSAVPSDKKPLPSSTRILVVAFDKDDTSSCYMLADDTPCCASMAIERTSSTCCARTASTSMLIATLQRRWRHSSARSLNVTIASCRRTTS